MRAISLFSGCGGLDMGAQLAGIEVILANDVLPEAAETHQRMLPDCTFVLGDIRTIHRFPRADLVMGGYPCQSFSMGGNRRPGADGRTELYLEFARCLDAVNPRFFVAENVSGLKSLGSGRWFHEQTRVFSSAGRHGYELSTQVMKAEDFGVPQRRKRLFIVGVRKDLAQRYVFPEPTHASSAQADKLGRLPYTSHGDIIRGLPLWPQGEFYERPHDPEGHFAWYYMSRNRKAPWDGPSFTIVANFRHVTLHPASPVMRMVWSDLANGWKQKWEFTDEHEHIEGHPDRPTLAEPRRLSWREAALIQTFPAEFEPAGSLEKKFEQIGNAVPVDLAHVILSALVSEKGLGPIAQSIGQLQFV